MVTKGERGGEGSIRSIGLTDTHYYIYKVDNQQGLLYSTGNYIQYLVITYNGQ